MFRNYMGRTEWQSVIGITTFCDLETLQNKPGWRGGLSVEGKTKNSHCEFLPVADLTPQDIADNLTRAFHFGDG